MTSRQPAQTPALTDRQRGILDFIEKNMRERGYPPSVREIGEAVNLTSPSTVHSHLASLQRMGFLHRDPTKPRAIEVRWDPSSDAVIERRPVRHVPLIGDVAAGTGSIVISDGASDTRTISITDATQVTISDLHGMPLVSVRDAALRGWRSALKRVVDVLVSGTVLVFASPVLLFLALLVKLSSPGPVFYAQERVGLNGKSFWVLKYRSMRTDAESKTGPIWASRGDSRATPLGRFLRRSSLDELPQFINVLMGDMSIVGPRPERPVFVEQFSQSIPDYWKRHWEKAGLTGWAQVNGLRGDTSIEERTAYDLWYVENWNLWLDFKIMLRTIPAMLRDSNG